MRRRLGCSAYEKKKISPAAWPQITHSPSNDANMRLFNYALPLI
jgi:hypothetical protein